MKALLDRGWAHRIMLGHDFAPGPVLAGRDDAPEERPNGYLHLSTVALPALREAGASKDQIDQMMQATPRAFLTGGQ